jgi:hypothetical protein
MSSVMANAATNTFVTPWTWGLNSSGTAATGFGTGFKFTLESSTTNSQDAGAVGFIWSDATHASRTSEYRVQTESLAGASLQSSIVHGRRVTLTEAGGAETVITITSATTQSFGLELSYKVHASDATPDYAVREGSLKLVCVNNATVVTCTKDATAQTDDESVLINTNAKTLTYAIATDVATANVAKITFNIDSDMTVTSASITFTAVLNGSGSIS